MKCSINSEVHHTVIEYDDSVVHQEGCKNTVQLLYICRRVYNKMVSSHKNQKYGIFFGTTSPVISAWLLWFFASHESPIMKLWQAKWCPQQHLCHLTVYSSTKFIWLEQSKQFYLKHHQQGRIHLPKFHLLFSINRKGKKISRNVKTQKGRAVNAVPYYSRSSLVFH